MTTSFASFESHLREFIRGDSSHQFEGLALELFRLQFESNPVYRKFCQAENRDPAVVRSWTDIPAVPTTAFKEFELTSIPTDDRTTVFCSSGTTVQRPGRHFHSAASLALYELSLLEWGRRHLPLHDATLQFLTPSQELAPHSSLVHMFETMRRHAPSHRATFIGDLDLEGNWNVNIPRAVSLLTACASSGEALGILGTAFNFVHLLDSLMALNLRLRLPAGSWVMETGGYKGRSRSIPKTELHKLISITLGVGPDRILCEYGMSELSSQAYDRSLISPAERSSVFQFPPWARATVVSPENGREVAEGQIGLLRVWDLANVYSAMAIETQDLAIRRGTGFELIGRADSAEPRGCSLRAN
jgi:hypothetical protein